MRALYLYFAEPARLDRDRSLGADIGGIVEDGPLVAIQPGAYSRWKANRDRVVAENAAGLRRGVDAPLFRRNRGDLAIG